MKERRLLTAAAGVAGLALFGWAVAAVGVPVAVGQLRLLWPVLPAIIALTALRYLLQAAAWQQAMPAGKPPAMRRLAIACLIGDAFGYLSFAGPFASVPARALLVRARVPIRDGVVAAALERLSVVVTAAAMVVGAIVIVAARRASSAGSPAALAQIIALALLSVAGVAMVTAIVGKAARRWVDLRAQPRRTLLLILCLATAQHAASLGEAWVMLRALGMDAPLRRIFVFEALMKLAGVPALFVPAGVGVYESASTLLADAVHLGAATGLALGLMRRIRALLFSAVAMVMLTSAGLKTRLTTR